MNDNRGLDKLKTRTANVLLLFLVVQMQIGFNAAKREPCKIDMYSRWNRRLPLFFNEKGQLYDVTGELGTTKITIAMDKEVIVSCGPNYFRNFADNRTTFVRGTFVGCEFEANMANGHKEVMPSPECDLRVIEEVVDKAAVPACGNSDWTATRYGYVHPLEQSTHIVGEACYDEKAGRTIFTHVKLNGDKPSILETANKQYLTRLRHPDGRYKIELFRGLNFDEIYEELRKATGAPSPLLSLTNFIDDPLLSNAQLSEVKKLGWNYLVVDDEVKALEALKDDVRKLSVSQPLDVFVGSIGVRQLANNVEVYLHEGARRKRFPMPKYIWLLVQHGEKVTGFGIFNGPSSEQPAEPLCESVCSQITWLTASRSLADAGLVCCNYAQMKAAVPELPALGVVKNLLI